MFSVAIMLMRWFAVVASVVNEDDDSTIRNLKLVPLPELADKAAKYVVIRDSLADVGTRTVVYGRPSEQTTEDVNALVAVCLSHGLWIRRVRFGTVTKAAMKRQARALALDKETVVVTPSLSISFQTVGGHEYNVSYGPRPPARSENFVLQEQTGIVYETDEIVSYSPAKILYKGLDRERLKQAIRKLGKPGMRAVLMD
jgi:hypothetical protein